MPLLGVCIKFPFRCSERFTTKRRNNHKGEEVHEESNHPCQCHALSQLGRAGHILTAADESPKQNFQAAKSPVSDDVPAEIQSAKEKLASARNDLSRAGDEWGGFRLAAMKNIHEAQANLQKALEYRQKNLKK